MPDGLPNVPQHLLQVPAPSRQWLIDEWRSAWKLHTVIAAAIFMLLSLAEANLAQLQAIVPIKYWPWVTVVFAILMPLLRVLRQPDWQKKLESQQ